MTISQGAIQILAFATSIVIARFLSPFEVGLAAEALVFASLALVIVDFGFASVIVQRSDLTEDDKSTAFWAGTALGVLLTLIGVAASWPIAALYGEPEVQPLFAVLSLAFLFTAPGIVQGGLLTRELAFRSLEVRTIIATVLSSATGITLADRRIRAWAIVAQDLVITSASTLLLWWASDWRPHSGSRSAASAAMAGYTGNVFGTRMLGLGDDQRRQLPDRPIRRGGSTRGLRPGVLGHGHARQPDRLADHARVLSGFLEARATPARIA